MPLQNLRIFGKSEQNGVPSPDAPIPIVSVGYKRNIKVDVTGKNILPKLPAVVSNGISAYVNEDGSIKITGTATNTWSDITKVEFKHFVRNGDYIFSVDKPLDFILGIKYRKCGTIEGQIIGRIKKTETETRYRIPEDNLSEELSIFIEGITIGKLYNVTFKPMLRNAECTDSSYEPYKEPQSLTLTTPNGLPGLKVDKGGNYTDSTGQQWICDEIDLGKGKYIQRIARRIYDGSENWNIYTSQNKPNSYGCENKDKAVAFTALFNRYVSMKHFALENGQGANGEFQTIIRNDNCTTIKSLKEELSKNNLEVIMQLKKPIEYDLMPEEIQAYKVLHTNYPTTVVTNDENADMELTYTVDTKSYVDTKIAEVSTAIVQKGIE